MIKPIMKDVFFLGQKSDPATKDDLQIGRDLMDTCLLYTSDAADE